MGDYARCVAGVCLVAFLFIAPGLMAEECDRADMALLDDAIRLTGYEATLPPVFEDAGENWPLTDMAFAYYQDGAGKVVVNNLQTMKLPAMEQCSVRLHEIVHHLQYLAGMTDLQARELEAYQAQQAWLNEMADEYTDQRHDGVFAVKHFKLIQRHLAQDYVPSDLLSAGLACRVQGQATICSR